MDNIGIDAEIENAFFVACSVCGWEYNESEDEFDQLPIDYNCIKCGTTKVNFMPFIVNKNKTR